MLSIFAFVIALCFVEGATRIFWPHPHYPDMMLPDERVGFLPQPHIHGRATNMFGEYDTQIQTNHEGFRDRDWPIVKSENTIRIAFLGDSFTYAEQVEESETFVRRTEKLLTEKLRHKDFRPHIECLNFGVGGYDTYEEVLCYEMFVRKYQPDIVVLAIYVGNDLLGNAFYLTDNGFGRPYFHLVNGALVKVPADTVKLTENYRKIRKVRWYQQLHFYNACKQFFWEIRQKRRRKSPVPIDQLWQLSDYHNYRYYAGDGHDPVVKEANTVTKLLLNRLLSEVVEDGGHLNIVLLPAEENILPEKWSQRVRQLPALKNMKMDFARPFNEIESFFPELTQQGDILDLREPLREASKIQSVFFRCDSHYNKWGQESVAQELTQWLQPRIEAIVASKIGLLDLYKERMKADL